MTRRLAVLALAGLVVVACFRLDSFLFHPDRLERYLVPEDVDANWRVRFVIPDSLYEEVELSSTGGNRIYGFFIRPAESERGPSLANRTTVIYAHGNWHSINRYWGRAELLWEAGCRVFIYDYQGYGRSEGSPSGAGCYDDARAALDYCRSRDDVEDSMIVFYGWSLGTFMTCHSAADLCRDSVPYLGVVLETPLASMSSIAREGAVLDIPGSYLADADFDNESRIGRIGRPVLLLRAEFDSSSVYERNSKPLVETARRRGVDLEDRMVPGAVHDDVPEAMGYEAYRQLVREFVSYCAAR
ncbi:MAG: alpha/beta hydrolase [bacterium]